MHEFNRVFHQHQCSHISSLICTLVLFGSSLGKIVHRNGKVNTQSLFRGKIIKQRPDIHTHTQFGQCPNANVCLSAADDAVADAAALAAIAL